MSRLIAGCGGEGIAYRVLAIAKEPKNKTEHDLFGRFLVLHPFQSISGTCPSISALSFNNMHYMALESGLILPLSMM